MSFSSFSKCIDTHVHRTVQIYTPLSSGTVVVVASPGLSTCFVRCYTIQFRFRQSPFVLVSVTINNKLEYTGFRLVYTERVLNICIEFYDFVNPGAEKREASSVCVSIWKIFDRRR